MAASTAASACASFALRLLHGVFGGLHALLRLHHAGLLRVDRGLARSSAATA